MRSIVMIQLISGVINFLDILSAMLVVYALMTWFMRPDNPVYIVFARIADVVLTPFRPISRKLINMGLHIDLSVILALLSIRIIRRLLVTLLYNFIF